MSVLYCPKTDEVCPTPGRCVKLCQKSALAVSDPRQVLAAEARKTLGLTQDSAERKATPICTGVLDYFPDALAEVARLSKAGNDKHNPGQPLHWSRDKSTDHADCIVRHLLDRGKLDEFGFLHEASVAWRALALLQLAIEARRAGAA